ncbi:hypothetical protein MKX03_028205 [Papaver bracteatum]|nr:hypothetical protein MKX03_028205 [Papaver bracteatum]
MRKVEELVLFIITSGKPFTLSFFTCDSLIMLNLEYYGILNLPNTISFPRLKILRLTSIDFVNENLTGELFSNCPILEELKFFDCRFQDLKVLCITSFTLKRLSIIDTSRHWQILKFITTGITRKYMLLIYIELFRKLSNVKLLKMSGSSFQGLSAANILFADLPTFGNLLSPNLESIVFSKGVHGDLGNDNWTVNSLPQYSLSNLKSVVMQNFIGYERELDVVKFFLANAGVLQTMTITTSQCLSKDYKKQTQIASE